MKRRSQGAVRVAFQGELGAFSQQAIRQFLGRAAVPVPCEHFEDVFAVLAGSKVRAAAIPIENTLHGSIYENYDLLMKHNFTITAETNVRVVHHLIAPPGLSFREVRRVFSKDVALNQCRDFFARNKQLRQEIFYDTAGSVKMIMEARPPGGAAIASELAAKIYGARILKREIEDDRQNYTRFFLLERSGAKPRTPRSSGKKPWKTSLVFSTRNVPGALFRALSALALRDLNLAKVESRPLRGKPFEYLFYLDFLGRPGDPNVAHALSHLGELADYLRILGTYRAA